MRYLVGLVGTVVLMLLVMPGTASACEVRYAAAAAAGNCGDTGKIVAVSVTVAGGSVSLAAARSLIQATGLSARELASVDARVLEWALRRAGTVGDELEEVEAAADGLAGMRGAARSGAGKVGDVVGFTEKEIQHPIVEAEVAQQSTPLYDPLTPLALGLTFGMHAWAFRDRLMVPLRRIAGAFRR
ncbi:hypothetical protein [Kutzneria chonburiensis]|uniref:Uncharacterized protein n=1 Tax=Kutzneria chonburiensis TaxID=1483604 RepID=A0ABV6MRM1_9PSEU|nr:hypothetical protein [Kutzneria chonburiensis]